MNKIRISTIILLVFGAAAALPLSVWTAGEDVPSLAGGSRASGVQNGDAPSDAMRGSGSPRERAMESQAIVTALTCEYKRNPAGIDVARPRLSWQIVSDRRGVSQAAYEIRAAAAPEDLASGKNLTWDTGKVLSDRSIHVEYAGPALESRRRVYWQVRIWDDRGDISDWSDTAYWEMGLLDRKDWRADWIRADVEEDPRISSPAHMLRKEFVLDGEVVSARAYITCLGLYEAELNGMRIGDGVLTPGWTAYHHHIPYQTYDITALLKTGANAVGVTLGDGWYRGFIGFQGQRNTYGTRLALLFQAEVEFAGGRRETIVSDGSWRSSNGGPIRMSDIYHGEDYDARLERNGWTRAGFADAGWKGVKIDDAPAARLVAPAGPPVRRVEQLTPAGLIVTPKGETVVDMGQNMVGRLRIRVQGPKGTVVTIRHAEVLDKDGNFYTDNLRAARQTVRYTLRGGGVETYEPHFTFQGFRYAAIEGWPGELKPEDVAGVVVHSDMTPSGTFECSHPLINRLQENIRWSQKGNFVDVPTDCPQRDERLGWTGDAQVFARTACFNYDAAAFFTKWLKDVAADRQSEGQIPHVVPDVLSIKTGRQGQSASAGWADAAVIVPWTLYLSYGDTRILEEMYDTMKGWVDYMAVRAGDRLLWENDFTFGDWLAFATDRSDYPGATTDKTLIRQAYFARSTDLLRRIARILGRTGDAERYDRLWTGIKDAFLNEFVTPNGRLASDTQTAYSLALSFDLLPDRLRPIAAGRLADDVKAFRHVTTGFLGAPLICRALGDFGYADEAFMLLTRETYPSWLYPVTRGATTIWERWDGLKPDGSFQNPGMNSFNHYAYGAVGEWLYGFVAGIEIDEKQPGYKHIVIQPHPGGGLTRAAAELRSLYGTISSSWRIAGDVMTLNIMIPANTAASVRLPNTDIETVRESGNKLDDAAGIMAFSREGRNVLVRVGSGTYAFQFRLR